MPIAVLMPVFSPAIEAATLSRWLVREGDAVAAGDLLAEIEIDKTTVEIEAPQNARVGRILVSEGTEAVRGDTLLALLLGKGEDTAALDRAISEHTAPDRPAPLASDDAVIWSDEQVRAAYNPEHYDVIPHSRMRKTVAARLTQAKSEIPHFYVSMDCRLDPLLSLRRDINASHPQDGDMPIRTSLNDFMIKALALSLMRVPRANASWTDDGLISHKQADIGFAVAVEGGLFTPVVRDAQALPLTEIAAKVRHMTERARKGNLSPDDYRGGSSTISNLGMYPVRRFTAVINPPQATILAVGKAERKPIVRRNDIEIATIVGVTLSCDHRVVDGAIGAQLLAAFKNLIEDHPDHLV